MVEQSKRYYIIKMMIKIDIVLKWTYNDKKLYGEVKTMKKKLLLVLATAIMCISLGACGKEDVTETTKATLVTAEGETVEMSSKELRDIYAENSVKYTTKYQLSAVTVTGTVDNVRSNMEYFGNIRKTVYRVTLKEGWEVMVLEEFHDEVVDLSAGDKVKITSTLQLVSGNVVCMQYIGQKDGWYDKSVIEVLTEE